MLKHAADLSDSHEYFLVWAGGTNARPWGPRQRATALFPDLQLGVDGIAFTSVVVGFGAGSSEILTVTRPFDAVDDPTFNKFGYPTCGANEWVGAILRLGSAASPVTGRALVLANQAIAQGGTGTFTVQWLDNATPATVSGYVCRATRRWAAYPQVRVLTPFQPFRDPSVGTVTRQVPYPSPAATFANGGKSLTLPAPYDGTPAAASFEDMGLLLPFSFFEGIAGFGISNISDSRSSPTTHAITAISSSVWTFENTIVSADLLNGGKLIVDWEHNGVMYRSWAEITDSTATTFTVANWTGDDTSTNLVTGHHAKVKRYTAWVPHFHDSPYAHLPGEGFTYPNHDMQPASDLVLNSARNQDTAAYGNAFGAMLVAAAKLSAATGKRINVVNLAITDATLSPSNGRNPYGYGGSLGWYDQQSHGTWAPNISTSIYARLDKLLRTILPNALAAEGNTKTARCLGIALVHGETDALELHARRHYSRARAQFVHGLRKLVTDLGYNPYQNGAEIPVMQPRIAYLPYGVDGTYSRASGRGGGSATYDADEAGLVNTAIEEGSAADEFAETVRVDDLPRLTDDPGIYSGVGEAELGARIADAMTLLVEHGLAHGSTVLATTQTSLVDLCNLALSHIGDAGQITSLTDGSEAARLCQRFLPEARDEILQSRQWGFALRRRSLIPIQRPEHRTTQRWDYCYVVPAEALFAFKVVPPATEPEGEFRYDQVATTAYETAFLANEGSALESPEIATAPPYRVEPDSQAGSGGAVVDAGGLLEVLTGDELDPQPYTIEVSPFGHRYLFTNQKHATLQYVRRVMDTDHYPPLFVSALAANLASKLASVMIKGDAGEAVSARMLQKVAGYMKMASASDAIQQRPSEKRRPFGFVPDHLRARTGGGPMEDRGGNSTDYRSGFTIN